MRLDRLLAELGYGSRKEIRELVRAGRVHVDDRIVKEPETKLSGQEEVRLDGTLLASEAPKPVIYMLNKPAGYLTAVRDSRYPVVTELLKDVLREVMPVGRLDLYTEGLLLFTDDGVLAHKLLSPRYRMPKTYYVETDRPIPEETAEILSKPVVFKEFTSLPGKYVKLTERSAYLTVFEGKYHEVKRLFHAAGCEVTYLKRVAFGPLTLSDLPAGAYRVLEKEEEEALRACLSKDQNPENNE